MTPRPSLRLRLGLSVLAALDVVAGVVLVVWPGLWQELLHPLAMGTVFYPLQRTGAAWLVRGAVAAWAARRPTGWRVAALGLLWAVEVPGALLLAWRTASTGPWTGPVYLGQGALALLICVALWRAAKRLETEELR